MPRLQPTETSSSLLSFGVRESLEELLVRLDAAIEKAWEEQEFVDEINDLRERFERAK